MKTILLISLLTLVNLPQAYSLEHFSRVSLDDKFNVHVQIDSSTVRCSSIGYGLPELKISVPALRFFAIFDHTNLGETEPCMTAGRCQIPWDDFQDGDLAPNDLIQDNPGAETMQIKRFLTEHFLLNREKKTCQRTLVENLSSNLRGLDFQHAEQREIGDLPFEVCLQIQASLNSSN